MVCKCEDHLDCLWCSWDTKTYLLCSNIPVKPEKWTGKNIALLKCNREKAGQPAGWDHCIKYDHNQSFAGLEILLW